MIEPFYDRDGITIYNADCRDVLKQIDHESVDLVLTDPPYYRVVNEPWDNQWDNPAAFLEFIDGLAVEWRRVLSAVGGLYCFASSEMAWGIEGILRQRFNFLNRITWAKPEHTGRHKAADKSTFRAYFPNSEVALFAEKRDADISAERLAGYHSEKESRQSAIFGDYLRAEFDRAGVATKEITALFPSRNGNPTGCVSNWLLGANRPTREQYEAIREFLNTRPRQGQAGAAVARRFLQTKYRDLIDQCEDATAELAELKEKYESTRRPFNGTKSRPHTDVWHYDPPPSGDRRFHPCEKPVRMMEDIILNSTRPGDVVLDCFGGSMRLAEVCRDHGRQFIGIELNESYCAGAVNRLSQLSLF